MGFWNGKSGVFLIAEIGGNHEGDFGYAKRLVGLACDSGADAVKFQIYTGDTLVSPIESPDRNAHFKKFELTREQYIALAEMCQSRGVAFNASVWDIEALDWIDPYMTFYKIGSGDLTAYPVLRAVAARNKPILLSTGLATEPEIEDCVAFIRGCNPLYQERDQLAIMQCTSMYPIPPEDANLNVMQMLRRRFGTVVGYSDHTVGAEAVETAVAMGAEVLEIHFTDDREGKEFRDHKVSLTASEMRALADKIERIRALQGSPVKQPVASEIEAGHVASFRRAVYPRRELTAGTVLTEADLTVLRPNRGIDARDFDKLIGKRLNRGVAAFERLQWDYLSG